MDREQTTLRISPELKEEVSQFANQVGISFNSAIIYLLQKGQELVSGRVSSQTLPHTSK